MNTENNWLNKFSQTYHLIMFPLNIANIYLASKINLSNKSDETNALAVYTFYSFLVSIVSWLGLDFLPVLFALFIDNSVFTGMPFFDIVKLLYIKLISGALNVGSTFYTL